MKFFVTASNSNSNVLNIMKIVSIIEKKVKGLIFMEKNLLNSPQPELNVIDSIFAEMVLDKALLDFRKEKIQQKIDQSLRDKNKREFIRLTEELKNVS